MTSKAMEKSKSNVPARAEAETPERRWPIYTPKVDIVESDSELTLIADMPGVDENNITVNLEGRELTFTGTPDITFSDEFEESYSEYTFGRYERSFTLGDAIDRDKIKALMKDGVLHLTLPKAKEAQPRTIKVIAG